MRTFVIQAAATLLLSLIANAQEATGTGTYAVRVITLSLPEHEIMRAAMNCPPEEESALFQSLTEQIGQGKVELVSDTFTRCLEAQEQEVAWIDEHPYCTEFRIDAKWRQVIPQSAAFRNLGGSIHCRIDRNAGGPEKTLTISWQRSRFAEKKTWPALTTEAFTPVSQPAFLLEELIATLSATESRWQLAGMNRDRSESRDRGGIARALLTFVRVTENSAREKAAPARRSSRMHSCVFRLPLQEALALAQRNPKEDAALLERLLQRAESGDLTMTFHGSCCGGGTETSKAGFTLEYPYPTDFTPDPVSFTFQNTGTTLTMALPPGKKSDATNIRVRWESCGKPVRFLQLSPQPAGADMTMPEFSNESIDIHVPPVPGSVCMAGAWALPEESGPRMASVCFIKFAGTSPGAPPIPPDHREAFAAAYSLPSNEAARLTAGGRTPSRGDIEPLINNGTARLLTWQCVTGTAGATGSVSRFNATPTATKAAMHTATGLIYGTKGTVHTIGDNFEIKLPASDGQEFFGGFSANWARMAPLDPKELVTAAKEGTALPSPFTDAKLVFPHPATSDGSGTRGPFAEPTASFPFKGMTGPALKLDAYQVVSFAPCTAPSGDPEHGRWHAVVLFVRK